MGKAICLILGLVGSIYSIFLIINSHKEWESYVREECLWHFRTYDAQEYFWSYGNETWFSYAVTGFILLGVSLIILIIGCCIKGNFRKSNIE